MVVDGGFCVVVPVEKTVISFGRYKGKALGSLPSGYLRWLAHPTSLEQDHSSIWAQLAKQVLRERTALQVLPEPDFEKPDNPTNAHLSSTQTAPWKNFLHNLDTLNTHVHPATFASFLQWCTSSQNLLQGFKAHHHILLHGLEHHQLLRCHIVQMYGICGALDDAKAYLVATQPTDPLTWNRLMKTYSQHGYIKEVLELFEFMLMQEIEPNRVTVLSILDVCGKHIHLHDGRLTHHFAFYVDLLSDVVLGNSLISMYGKCGSVDDAHQVFEQMPTSDIVTWNALIAVFGQNRHSQMSIHLHLQMKEEGHLPDDVTYVSILDACANMSSLLEGHRVHVHVLAMHLESNVVIGTALVNMYGKCGMPEDAQKSFDKICQRNTVCWTAIIAAYAQNERGKDALELFTLMEQAGVHPNRVTFVSVLDACATTANLWYGEKLFNRIKNSRFATNVKVATALINMYGRCGRVEDARTIFDRLPDRDLATWNAMVAAYAQHGQAQHAFQLFYQMKQKRVKPDLITYVSILSMCSRVGLIHEACELFTSMERDHGIVSVEHHQNCIVDLLAKAGKLEEAEHLIQDLPAGQQSSCVPVMTLLGACNNQIDIGRGRRMAQLLFRLGRGAKDPYVMMLGIRAAHSVHRLARRVSKDKSLNNLHSKCVIRLGGRVHQFISDDRSHPLMDDICSELTRLTTEMQRAGNFAFIPQEDLEAFDQGQHTGMLSAAFGLIGTYPGTPLYITKDTNLCSICHAVIEYMSKVTSRKIVVKDAFRLHRFKNGVCSCAC